MGTDGDAPPTNTCDKHLTCFFRCIAGYDGSKALKLISCGEGDSKGAQLLLESHTPVKPRPLRIPACADPNGSPMHQPIIGLTCLWLSELTDAIADPDQVYYGIINSPNGVLLCSVLNIISNAHT